MSFHSPAWGWRWSILFRPLLDPKPYGFDLILIQGRLLDGHQQARTTG
jgi:hypothetical protein